MAIDLDVHGNTKPLEAAVQAAINRIRRQPIKITVDDKGATQPLGNMKRAADEFSKSMEAANARILAFGASMAIINGVADAFKGMVRNLVEVEKSLADINVVMGLSNQNIEKFGDGLFKVAKETGAAFRVAADAATEYARQGLAMEETLKRTRDALILTRLTGMDSAEAVKALTAAMNTYGNQIKDTTQLVSKFAAVDVQFAVSAEDFAAAISRTGQSAKSAGVDINELIGIVTSAQQQTARGGAVIGNALKSIFTKIGKPEALNQLENLGIAVRDIEGNSIGAKKILTDLAGTFDTLSEAQQAQISQTIAGLFHVNIFKAVLKDAAKQNSILANATQISANATDEAIQKNEQLRNTISAMAGETGNAVKQLSVQVGELMLAPGMEKILNAVKGLAEGASSILGDGEGAGSRFASGFLKGLGNVITGPGLIVITTVFVKLFMTAAKFTKESLSSLIGVTSEAQKQKAIQTSLVSLIGQNAALGKEMLRTDISRTEKEKILLGLLRMQTAEATRLNDVSKQLASTLYTRGYGPGLTTGRRRAYGHIPNYADPERSQAARGGYAAGSIRSMNMPGEGSIIYNSAETVKNFAGFKQPAIMPPQSSKAGKNYQQAFGNIHGFDPYAAGGYIPNFNKKFGAGLGPKPTPKNLQSQKMGTLNSDSSLILLTADSSSDGKSQFFVGKGAQGDVRVLNSENLASKRTTGFYEVKVPYYSLDKSDKDKKSKTDLPAIQEAIMRAASNKALDIAKAIVGGEKNLKPYNKKQIEETFNKGAFKGAAGSAFESAIAASLKSHLFQDYKARTDTSAIDLPYDPRMFQFFGAPAGHGKMGAEVKADLAKDLQQGAATKFFQVLTGGRAAWEYKDKDYKDKTGGRAAYAGLERRGSGYFKKRKAYGHIPNFADPLSDAIGREKAAGVPVSQIRVGSHSALMSKSNPLGLGVTNTHDEPNGLRDVFGANGFVPNYATQGFGASDFISGNLSRQAREANRKLKMLTDSFENGRLSQENLNRGIKNITAKYNLSSQVTDRVVASANENIKVTSRLNAARKRVTRSMGRGVGRIAGGMGGGMTALAIGQMSGFVENPRLSGAMQSASSGAMIGSMLSPVLGPLAPFGTLIGTAAGALYGFVSATEDATKAQMEAGKEMAQSILSTPIAAQAFKSIGSQEMKRLANLESELKGGFDIKFKEKKGEIEQFFNDPNVQRTGMMVSGGSVGLSYGKSSSLESAKKDLSQELDVEAATARKSALIKALETLDPSTSFMGKGLKDGKEKPFTTGTFLSEIRDLDLTKKGDQEALKQAFQNGLILRQKLNTETENQRKAIIVQLNIQKAMIASQQKSAEAQLDIKERFLNQSSILNAQEKLMGGLMTEQQKAQLKYIKSVNKAEEAFANAEATANATLKSGILQKIKSSESLQQQLRQQLGAEGAGDDLIRDISDKVAGMSSSELIETLKEIKEKNKENTDIQREINLLMDTELQKRTNAVSIAERQEEISKNQASNELKINQILAGRKQIMSDLQRSNEMASEQMRHEQKIRGIGARVASARRLAGVGPGYQTREQQEVFQIEEKRFAMEEKIQTLQENQAEKIRKLNEKQALDQMDQQKLEDYRQNLVAAEDWDMEDFSRLEDTEKARKENLEKIGQELKNINTETDKEIAAEKELLAIEEKRLKAKRAHETGPGAFGNGMADAFKSMRDQVATMDYELGEKIPYAFADGMANAMTEALNGTKNIKEALTDAAISFLGMIQKAMMQKAAYSIVGAMGFSRGGNVRNYSRGGGVPAMVSNGEYVMGRDAVARYGGSFMHGLNAGGKIPGFSGGGGVEADLLAQGKIRRESDYAGPGAAGSALAANFGGGRGFASGRQYQRRAMSGFFYAQSGNVGLGEDTAAIGSILQEEERRRQEAEARRQAKKAKRRQLLGMVLGTIAAAGISSVMQGGNLTGTAKAAGYGANTPAGVNMAIDSNGMAVSTLPGADLAGSGLTNVTATRSLNPFSWGSPSTINPALAPFFYDRRYLGGPIRKYASGGYISGKSGIDQIPAMLSEGEYVIRASSARQIGKPMLDRINAGKFNEGGAVSELMGSSETAASGGNTNNINISINMERGSGSKKENQSQDSSGQNPADRSSDEQNNAALAERIKQQVVAVIVEEQRPGGLLSE